ncbi:Kinesin-like protein [Nymphaea thermarum]|nr:Kinesin-like protein [Nymphaea thermarum]
MASTMEGGCRLRAWVAAAPIHHPPAGPDSPLVAGGRVLFFSAVPSYSAKSVERGSWSDCADHVFDETCTNLRVYERHTKDVNQAAVKEFNGTVFAYGQTSSGNTLTRSGKTSVRGAWADNMTWFKGDLLVPDSLKDAFDGVTAVVSCVGGFGSNSHMYKVNGTANINAIRAASEK